jgi:succinoglycan biosynthesis transport protein ExoP
VAKPGMSRKPIVTPSKPNRVDIQQILTILHRRRWLIFGFSFVVISATSLLAVMAKPLYQSTMQILVTYNSDDGLATNKNQITPQPKGTKAIIPAVDYTTQMKLMLSTKLVQKAVDLLQIDYPNLTLEEMRGKNAPGQTGALEVAIVEGKSQNHPSLSQVFTVSFKGRDPLKTKRVLQALQKVYQDYNLEQKKQRLDQGLAFVNSRVPKVRKDLLAAEQKLAQFRKTNNFIDPGLQSKILLESLANIQKQIQTNRTELQQQQERYASLVQRLATQQRNAQSSPNINQSSQYQALLNEIRKNDQELAKASILYTDNYPTVVKLKQQRQVLEVLLQQAEQTAKNNNSQSKAAAIDPNLVNEINQLQGSLATLKNKENNLAQTEQRIRSQLTNYPNLIADYNRLRSDVDTQRKTFNQLLQLQQSLGMKIAQGGFNWQVVEEPALGIYMGNRQWLIILAGVLIGPILGMVASLIWELFNQKILSPQDLQNLTHLPLLGSVPKLDQSSGGIKNKIQQLMGQKPKSLPPANPDANIQLPSHESLDMIYQNIQIFKNPLTLKSLMLTSALPGEGKTTLALGLGFSAAHMHQKVLLIDANLRSPSLHKTLELSNDWGLSLLLVDDINTQVKNYIQPIHPSIDILTAGPIPEDAVNLLSSRRMQELIVSLEKMYDVVLIDAPAILNTVDGRILASLCDGIVMIGRIGHLNPNQLLEATAVLSKLNLIGMIANDVVDAGKFWSILETNSPDTAIIR